MTWEQEPLSGDAWHDLTEKLEPLRRLVPDTDESYA